MDARTGENDFTRESLCGRTLGDYHIERRVGGGATSDVFLAKQISLSRPVALKILKDELANDEKYVKRFLQEARAAARLEHPNIVRIYEVGELIDQGDRKRKFSRAPSKTYRFIAQEYVDGMSLAQYLRRNGTTTIMQTFAALEQIASALKRASDNNIVHRDVKPENVLIDATGTMKVVDFGLAHSSDSVENSINTTTLTCTGVALGTPLYMSPEQARGQKLDSRSDIYSLGVTAYRMLTGTPPFYGDTPLAVVLKHLNDRPRPIKELRPDAPDSLVDLVQRMLAKKPADRPDSVSALLVELRAARREYAAVLQEKSGQETVAVTIARDDDGRALSTSGFDVEALGNSSSNLDDELGFFQSSDERDGFQHALHTTNVSREWQTSVAQLETTALNDGRLLTRRNLLWTSGVLVAAFLLGGVVLLLRNQVVAANDAEPELTIQKQNTVEEQYVFALQLGAVDAWKSVEKYFPNDEYWTSCARRQLAWAYVQEKNVDEAEACFKEMESKSSPSVTNDRMCVAGLAWVDASRGNFNGAAARLSSLVDGPPLDGLTESILLETQALCQNRNDFPDVWPKTPRRSSQAPGRGPAPRDGSNDQTRPSRMGRGNAAPNGSRQAPPRQREEQRDRAEERPNDSNP